MQIPPRKLSMTDDAFLHYWRDAKLKVFLDGEEQKYVVAYDQDAGIVERYAEDEKGRIKVADNDTLTETVHGTVTVTAE